MRVEDVQAFLQNSTERRIVRGVSHWKIDRNDLRAHFMRQIEKLEDHAALLAHARLADGLDDLADVLERLPDDQFRYATQEYAHLVVSTAVLHHSRAATLEQRDALRVFRLCLSHGVLTRQYAQQNHLIRANGELTSLGRPLGQMASTEAVRWLLAVESEQTRGTFDEWHVGEQVLAELAEGLPLYDLPEGLPLEPRSWARLVDFGVIRRVWVSQSLGSGELRLTDPAFANPAPAQWRTAIRAALADERDAVVPAPREPALDAAREQVRLITHEVRNALVPTRHHLDTLLKAQTLDVERVRKAHDGVKRTLQFVDEMVTTSELMAERPTVIAVEALMRRVTGNIGEPERVHLRPSAGSLKTHVDQLARGLMNVVLNAVQLPAVKQIIFAARIEGQHAVLSVDDDGPGVPSDDRERIFDDGFTTRPGGSGFGLAFARKVIAANGGSIRCERSDLGGARFVITLPLQEPTS